MTTTLTAQEHREAAARHYQEAADSFERCDTDGFLSQWAAGKSLRDSIVFASANSTSVVTKIGAKAGILPKAARLHDMPLHEEAL